MYCTQETISAVCTDVVNMQTRLSLDTSKINGTRLVGDFDEVANHKKVDDVDGAEDEAG